MFMNVVVPTIMVSFVLDLLIDMFFAGNLSHLTRCLIAFSTAFIVFAIFTTVYKKTSNREQILIDKLDSCEFIGQYEYSFLSLLFSLVDDANRNCIIETLVNSDSHPYVIDKMLSYTDQYMSLLGAYETEVNNHKQNLLCFLYEHRLETCLGYALYLNKYGVNGMTKNEPNIEKAQTEVLAKYEYLLKKYLFDFTKSFNNAILQKINFSQLIILNEGK